MPSFPIDNYLIQISGNDLLCDLNRWGDKIIHIYSGNKYCDCVFLTRRH